MEGAAAALASAATRTGLTGIGTTGFEPATSASQTRRSNQAELRPVSTKGRAHGHLREESPSPCNTLGVLLLLGRSVEVD